MTYEQYAEFHRNHFAKLATERPEDYKQSLAQIEDMQAKYEANRPSFFGGSFFGR